MRVTRDYVFDMIDLVGRAVVTARRKRAGPEWDLDHLLRAMNEVDDMVEEKAADEYGLFADQPWEEKPGPKRAWSPWGSEGFEQRKAQRFYDEHGDSVACSLWDIQRRLSFKAVGAHEALKELQELCSRITGYISGGWANQLARIVDGASR